MSLDSLKIYKQYPTAATYCLFYEESTNVLLHCKAASVVKESKVTTILSCPLPTTE